MNSSFKPVMRSSDMKPQHKEIVMKLAQDVMDGYNDIEIKQHEIAALVRKQLYNDFKAIGTEGDTNEWSVALGKNFIVSTNAKTGWHAHVYLKHHISMLVWKIN